MEWVLGGVYDPLPEGIVLALRASAELTGILIGDTGLAHPTPEQDQHQISSICPLYRNSPKPKVGDQILSLDPKACVQNGRERR